MTGSSTIAQTCPMTAHVLLNHWTIGASLRAKHRACPLLNGCPKRRIDPGPSSFLSVHTINSLRLNRHDVAGEGGVVQ